MIYPQRVKIHWGQNQRSLCERVLNRLRPGPGTATEVTGHTETVRVRRLRMLQDPGVQESLTRREK